MHHRSMTPIISSAGDSAPRLLCILSAHAQAINTLSWSHDGTRLASAADAQSLMIWEQRGMEEGTSAPYGSEESKITVRHA